METRMSSELLLLISVVLTGTIVVFGWIIARKLATAPDQREAIRDMSAKIAEQTILINALQRQSAEQWTRITDQEKQLVEMRAENATLKRLTEDQNVIIRTLQRQLSGLATGNQRTGRRLREVLSKRLNVEELKMWSQDLGIPYENLSGETLPALIMSMLDTLERYGRLEEGLAELRRRRPDIELDAAL
jgi:predicted RNase H-like nuclease (RuvC/YqgF family)